MIFDSHSDLAGRHALLSPSKYHWINYSDEKFDDFVVNSASAQRGVGLHELAALAIKHRVKLPRTNKTLDAYVNDAIGFRMRPEQIVKASDYAFGTADALAFRKNFLRIHDLKTGTNDGHPEQLKVYAAYFCIEYGLKPGLIQMELRIYQHDDVQIFVPEPEEIARIMSKTMYFSKRIEELLADIL